MILKDRIIQHYDELSAYYRDLWGVHIHHGYWKTGQETKEEAQEQLIRELLWRAKIGNRARILDVGCGLGGTAIYLNKFLGAHVVGITISPTQIKIGNDLVKESGADVRLVLMDAENLKIDGRFDIVWSVEAISHLNKKADFFRSSARLLRMGGKLVIADWLRSDKLSAAEERKYIAPIERAMLVPRLGSPTDYMNDVRSAGLEVRSFEDVSTRVSKTWDISIELAKNTALWKFAATRGRDFVGFLQGFTAMKAGYESKAFVYGMLVAQKI
jgi:cyclopropane fatty-acyl-phospholipid synthase-like methyltransferase